MIVKVRLNSSFESSCFSGVELLICEALNVFLGHGDDGLGDPGIGDPLFGEFSDRRALATSLLLLSTPGLRLAAAKDFLSWDTLFSLGDSISDIRLRGEVLGALPLGWSSGRWTGVRLCGWNGKRRGVVRHWRRASNSDARLVVATGVVLSVWLAAICFLVLVSSARFIRDWGVRLGVAPAVPAGR